ncbi:MFS transporter [Sphingopyxis sp. OPL5]|uniref:MFS transporter n=1 Tax=Sphingopyxis sp. OPL5 TaxID=2486273 RepID=UPI00223BA135|nr:MFS transporter [Sphingopyxis sp. OPL5]
MPRAEHRSGSGLVAAVCIGGPALVSLIPMAAAPAMVAMARHFGASADSQLFSQIVMTLPAAMLVLSAPLAGLLAGKIGQRAVLLASLVLYVIGGAGVLLISSSEALMALRVLLGIAGGGVLTSCLGLIGDHFEGHARERLLGYATSAASLLAGLALVFGGRLVDVAGWQAPFALYLLGIPTLLVAMAVIRDMPVRAAEQEARAAAAPRGHAREIGKVWPYYLLLILLTLGMFTPAIQAGFVLEARGIGSQQTIGSVIAATSFVAMFTAWAYGHLRRWIGLHGFLVIDAMCMGAGIVLIGLASSTAMIFAGCCLVGIGAGMSEPAIASLIFRKASAASHAIAMGLIVSALNAGQFFNPLIFDPLRRSYGPGNAFLVVGAVLLVVGIYIILRHRRDLLQKESET